MATKIITYGKSQSRYALIVMVLNRKTGLCVDNCIRFYYSDNLKALLEKQLKLSESFITRPEMLDDHIYDYRKMCYVG